MDRRELHKGPGHRGRSPERDSLAEQRKRRPSQKELERARRERMQRKAEARRRLEEAERRKDMRVPKDGRQRPSGNVSKQRPASRPAAAAPGGQRGRGQRLVSKVSAEHTSRKSIPLRLKVILGAVVTVTLIAVLSLTVLFQVEAIIVEGDSRYTPEEIVAASRIAVGKDNLFLCGRDSGAAIQKNLPYISEVRLQKQLPATVTIYVTETAPMFCLQQDKQWYTFDAGNKLLEISDSRPEDLIQVDGLLIDRSELGEITTFFEASKIRALGEMCRIITENDIQGIVSINMENSLDVRMNYENRFIIKLGIPNDLDTKLRHVMAVIREEMKSTEKGTLDISSGKNVHYSPNESPKSDRNS